MSVYDPAGDKVFDAQGNRVRVRSVRQRDPRRAYRVVDDFEAELADYTGAKHAVCVNSCTNAIFLALTWERRQWPISVSVLLPRRTYVGVLQAALNAGCSVSFLDYEWQQHGYYGLGLGVHDMARRLPHRSNMSLGGHCCLSFHSAKQLPLGRGGAILTNDAAAADWFRAARMDGRAPGSDRTIFPGWHMPMAPDVAARGLDILSRWNDADYVPPPLPYTDYPDLSAIAYAAPSNPSGAGPERMTVNP